jgi:hypothetical protein
MFRHEWARIPTGSAGGLFLVFAVGELIVKYYRLEMGERLYQVINHLVGLIGAFAGGMVMTLFVAKAWLPWKRREPLSP